MTHPTAEQIEQAVRGWLEGDDDRPTMAAVIAPLLLAAERAAGERMKERCADCVERAVFARDPLSMALAIRALPDEEESGGS